MRKILAVALLSFVFVAGPASSDEHRHQAIGEALGQALGAKGLGHGDWLVIDRQELEGGLAHYQLGIPVGAGEFDVIQLHRIVRERAPWIPERARRGVLLAHGDGWGFEPTFVAGRTSPPTPDRQNLAVFLAERGIDVWGVDRRWVSVPADTADLAFMSEWDFETSVDDLDVAASAARVLRFLTGSGRSKLTLVGFSRGGQLGWSLLGRESQRPRRIRNIRAFVAMEHTFKTDDETLRQAECASVDAIQAQIDAGEVATGFGVVAEIGQLALDDPSSPSPFFPALDNADLAEFIGADPGGGAILHFHSVGGTVDPDTFETELLYTEPERWFAFLAGIAPFQPLGVNLQGAELVCDEADSPFDDHLADVEVPVLYVGVAGAFGALGTYTPTLTAATDVSSRVVSLTSDPVFDLGHNDPFLAEVAEEEVWQPILDWIEAR